MVLVTGAVTAAGTTAAGATDKTPRAQAGLSWTGNSEALSTAPQVLSIPGVVILALGTVLHLFVGFGYLRIMKDTAVRQRDASA